MNDKAGTTSAIAFENPIKQQHDEDLKAVLAPKLTKVKASRTRKHSSKLKTHAQALEISTLKKTLKNNSILQERKWKENATLKSITYELSLEIKSIKTQLSLMNQLI